MRIRSIKPEFWRSDDISGLSWDDRLLFIGLWSYVDDNGVGMDRLASIVADLFAGDIERDSSETFARVSRGLQSLSDAGRIVRYEVNGKKYLSVTNWDKHQRIDKPNRERYPRKDAENAVIAPQFATPSGESRETPAPGTEEQGNRGTGEQRKRTPSSKPAASKEFETFWDTYPRKVGKEAAKKAFAKALTKTTPEAIQAGVMQLCREVAGKEPRFTPHAATWLNAGRWDDEVDKPQLTIVPAMYGWANR